MSQTAKERWSKSTASPPVLGKLEAAKVLSVLADILASSSSSVVLGARSKDSDPICEALRRLIYSEAPLLVQREIIPGNPLTTEVFDVRDMITDIAYMQACLEFRTDTSVPESGMTSEEIIERMGQYKKPMSVTGTFSFDAQDEEEDDDADDDDDDS